MSQREEHRLTAGGEVHGERPSGFPGVERVREGKEPGRPAPEPLRRVLAKMAVVSEMLDWAEATSRARRPSGRSRLSLENLDDAVREENEAAG